MAQAGEIFNYRCGELSWRINSSFIGGAMSEGGVIRAERAIQISGRTLWQYGMSFTGILSNRRRR